MIAKMKVYPRMLLKTKDRNFMVPAKARMYMKTKPLIGANPEY